MTTINRAPWTALVDDSGQNLDGSIWNKAAIKGVLLDPIDAALATLDAKDALIQTGAWTSAAGSVYGLDGNGLVLGNGTAINRSAIIGKTCFFSFQFVVGSTTSVGSSSFWVFVLPSPALNVANYGAFSVACRNQAGAVFGPAIAHAYDTQGVYCTTSTGALINPTNPFTWVTGCQLIIRGTFELP
jgi:hypothetical protein